MSQGLMIGTPRIINEQSARLLGKLDTLRRQNNGVFLTANMRWDRRAFVDMLVLVESKPGRCQYYIFCLN